MKNLFKRIIAAITAATLAAGSVPLNMTASAQLAPVRLTVTVCFHRCRKNI